MKKPNFTLAILSQTGMRNVMKTIGAFSILITLSLIFTQQAFAQVDCNSIMACGGKVNISVDENCQVIIQPDMITDDQAYPNIYYDVEARLNGQLLPSLTGQGTFNGQPIKRPALTNAHIGKTLEVKVILRGCGNSCWGSALIEDKFAPIPSVFPCVERITRFRDTIAGTGPNYLRPLSSVCTDVDLDCDLSTPAIDGCYLNSDYVVFQFALTESGIVDININPIGGIANPTFTLYENEFISSTPCINKISNNLLSNSPSLLAGVNYFIVVAVADGIVDIPVSVAIEHRTGHIVPQAGNTVCTVTCQNEAALLAQTSTNAQNRPTFSDRCSSVTLSKTDIIESLGCESEYSKIVKRTWKAVDAYGNVSNAATQFFYVRRIQLSEVICPEERVVLECTTTFPKLPNGAPTPAFSGMPSNLSCQNIQFWYEDVLFPTCGAGVKVSRIWHIIDWCTGEEKTCPQSISIIDTRGPVFTCPRDITTQSGTIQPADIAVVSSDGCTATWTVIPPTLVYDCSKVTWDVAFKKADESGNAPPVDAAFVKIDGITKVTGTKPNLSSTISSTVRPFQIEGLPLGRVWLKYTATDECGNSTDCFTELDIVDRTPPTAICDGTTVVTIDETGWAEVHATSIDDHSRDNCGGTLRYEIKRNTPSCAGATDTNFGSSIKLCCNDFFAPNRLVPVTLRVYDAAGNFNDCETNILVQLSRSSTVTCPAARSISCTDTRLAAWASGTSQFDTTFFGRPTLSGICISSNKFTSSITSDTRNAKCGTGTIVREWTLVGNTAVKCSQTVTVTSTAFVASNVTFPADRELNTCDIAAAEPEVINSQPIITNQACRDLGVSKTDQIFYNSSEACIKIIRTWKVIDWCTYPQTNQIFEDVQIILLKGGDAPVFSNCKDITVSTPSSTCTADVLLSATASDICTDAADIKYTWKLDINNDGSFNANGIGNSFTRTLEVGIHSVTFTAVNKCGKSRDCKHRITVVSTKKPTPICLREVVWVLDATGSTEVWASDFDLKSEGACGSTSLKFSFDEAGLKTAQTFTCDDIPNGQVARIPLKMYVRDSFGNTEYCDVILILQDSPLNNKCKDEAGLLPTIQGVIATEMQEGVEEVEVKLTNMQTSDIRTAMSGNEGAYVIDGVDIFDTKTIEANDNTDHLNGVSTLDLVLMQRHILGISKLNSPYKLLAADVNNSRTITASDLVNLRKLILGITLEFENNNSWRFVPSYYQFADPTSPFDYPSKISLDSLFDDKNNVNFVAVKVGDVNNSIVANVAGGNVSSRTRTQLMTYEPQVYRSGDVVKIDIKAGSDFDMIGAQMAIKYDNASLTFKAIESQGIEIKNNQYTAQEGVIKISSDNAKGLSLKSSQSMMTLVFVANQSGEVELAIDATNNLVTELYDTEANALDLDLQARVDIETGSQNILYQNEPNPFKDNTKIAFELQNAGDASVRVMDVNGKIVYQVRQAFEKGYNVVLINSGELSTAGVYYYQVETEGFSDTKKMILIK